MVGPEVYPWGAFKVFSSAASENEVFIAAPVGALRVTPVYAMVGDFTHQVAKGDARLLSRECHTSCYGSIDLDEEVWAHVHDSLLGCTRPQPTSFKEFLSEKNMDANPGYPWVNRYRTFRELLEAHGPDALEAFAEHVEREVENGREVQTAFKVHSKEDKYGPLKLEAGRYRAIYAPDWVLLRVMEKYCRSVVKDIEECVEDVVVVINGQLWPTRVAKPFEDDDTADVDYSAYDKTIPMLVVYKVVYEVMSAGGASENVASWAARQVACAPLVMPDGEVVYRLGGNPSGNLLTTILNSWWSKYGWGKSVKETVPGDLWTRLRLRVSGDDAVVAVGGNAGIPKALVGEIFQGLKTYANQTAKTAMCSGGPFPRGFHAPFLGRVSFEHFGVVVTFPLEPGRNLARMQSRSKGATDQMYAQSLCGIRQSLAGFVYREVAGLQIPSTVACALRYMYQWKDERPQLDWRGWLDEDRLLHSHLGLDEW